MNVLKKRGVGIVAFVAILLLILGGVNIAVRAHMAGSAGDCRSIQTILGEGATSTADKEYLKQELRACNGEDLDKSEAPSATPTATTTAKKTSSSKPSSSVSSSKTAEPASRQVEYLANRAPIEKTGVNSFGPKMGLTIAKPITEMSQSQVIKELQYRMHLDPMLTAATGAELGAWDYADVDAKTKVFANDFAAWDAALAKINTIIAKANVSIVHLNGTYTASYAIPGSTPSVLTGMDISRDGQLALSINGKLFQLHCGFQAYWKQREAGVAAAPKGSTPMPTPSKGMTRTPWGTPKKAETHRGGNGGGNTTTTTTTGTPSTNVSTPTPSGSSTTPTSTPSSSTPTPSKTTSTSTPPTTPTPTKTLKPKKPAEDVNRNPAVSDHKKATDGSAKVNHNNGSTDSQGIQESPRADASKASASASKAATSAASQHASATSEAKASGAGKVDNGATAPASDPNSDGSGW